MQDAKAYIAQIEAEIARTDEILTGLTQAASEFAELDIPLTPEMQTLFERLEALGDKPLSVDAALQFSIRG